MTKSEYYDLPPEQKVEATRQLLNGELILTDDLTNDMPDIFKDIFYPKS